MAKFIDGKTYNKITHLCDLLVLLNNDLDDRNDVAICWDMNSDGIFSMSVAVFHGENPRLEETVMWFFRDDKDEAEYYKMIDKINQWEKKYGRVQPEGDLRVGAVLRESAPRG